MFSIIFAETDDEDEDEDENYSSDNADQHNVPPIKAWDVFISGICKTRLNTIN